MVETLEAGLDRQELSIGWAYPGDLLSAMQRLDRRLQRAVEAAQAIYGAAAAFDQFRGLHIDQDEVERLLAREPGTPILHTNDHEPDFLQSVPGGETSRLAWLKQEYGLSSFELDVLLIALSSELDLRYERLYAYLQDDVTHRRPTVDLALNLLCPTAEAKIQRRTSFMADAPLIRHNLLHLIADPEQVAPSLLSHYLKLDEQILGLLLYEKSIDRRLAPFCEISYPTIDLNELPISSDVKHALQAMVTRAWESRVSLNLYLCGPKNVEKRQVAEGLANGIGAQLLTVDLVRARACNMDIDQTLRLASREGRFKPAVLYLHNLDELHNSESVIPYQSIPEILNENIGIHIMAGIQPWTQLSSPNGHDDRGVISVPLSVPDFAQRRTYWQAELAKASIKVEPTDLDSLADRFRFTVNQISQAVAVAQQQIRWLAATDLSTGTSRKVSLSDLFAAARHESDHGLATLARKVEPRYTWKDIILPADSLAQLQEISNQAKFRPTVYEKWGYGRRMTLGKDLTVLFSGPPGTGKTMAAEVIANDLGLDLYKIDLARVVSKYIGDTEKNLDMIFTAATTANAILFFDEADTLFGKRSQVKDAHDRYANIEIGYLLQKMEEYDGIAVLATNLRANMDGAFVRRLKFDVEFPFPEESHRYRIWQMHFPSEAPRSDDVDFSFLARQFKLAGGSIRNIVVNASFLAAAADEPISMIHLIMATKREYQKMGRSCSQADFAQYYPVVNKHV